MWCRPGRSNKSWRGHGSRKAGTEVLKACSVLSSLPMLAAAVPIRPAFSSPGKNGRDGSLDQKKKKKKKKQCSTMRSCEYWVRSTAVILGGGRALLLHYLGCVFCFVLKHTSLFSNFMLASRLALSTVVAKGRTGYW